MSQQAQYTGIFPRESGNTPQRDECYCCGKPTQVDCQRFILDRDSREVMDPRAPDTTEVGMFAVPIGPECRKFLPGVTRYAVDAHANPIACVKCGRIRTLVAETGKCGTCHHREERRINCREMWGHGRSGY
jgi:hypothetical protein